jgi:hypothetical protein
LFRWAWQALEEDHGGEDKEDKNHLLQSQVASLNCLALIAVYNDFGGCH